MMFFVAKVSAQVTFTQITSLDELTTGEYLIVGDGSSTDGLMLNQQNASGHSTFIKHTPFVNSGSTISSGFTSDNVFEITVSGSQLTIYHPEVGYVTYRSTGNHASFYNGEPTDSEKWTASVTDGGMFVLNNVNASSRMLQWNQGTPRFACYNSSSNQINLKLYKKQEVATSGFTITVTQPLGGTISPSGVVEVEEGGSATFTATPESSCYVFSHWIVDGEDAGNVNPYVFSNVNENHTLTAVFTDVEYTIVSSAGANGTISPLGEISVGCGDSITFTITPDSGYAVADVLVNGVPVGAVTTYTFEDVTENQTISASFVEYTGPCGNEDFETTDIANAYSDGSFTNNGITWTYAHSRNEGDYPIDSKGIMLRNAKDSYLEATISGGIGTFSFDYRKAFTGGNDRQLELIVNGVQVATTPVFGAGSGEDPTVHTFTHTLNIEGPVTIRIKNVGETDANRQAVIDNISWYCDVAEPCVNTVTATAGSGGTIDPSGEVEVECGSDITFTITPDAEYEIADVLVDGVSVGAVSTYTFENVTEAHTIEATFELIPVPDNCFVETFNDLTEIPSGLTYGEGSYTNNGITWYFHGQSPIGAGSDGANYSIDGQGILLRRASDSYLEATIPAGVGTFSFEYRKAYTGGNSRQLELLVDGISVASTPEFGAGSGEDPTVYTFSHLLNTETPVTVRIKLTGDSTDNRHVTVDNLAWTCFEVEPCGTPVPIVEDQEFCEGATVADLIAEGENIKWYANFNSVLPLNEETELESGVYYATQTLDGCESPKAAVQVVVKEKPEAPIAESPQYFEEGATLADLVVEGENLTWYDEEGNVLPADTVLVAGTTYYVTQTIDGCESDATEVYVDIALGNGGEVLAGLYVYPNPVKDVLTIQNQNPIDRVEIYALNGAKVMIVEAALNKINIDTQHLQSGTYIVKVISGNQVKSIKVIKK